MKPIKPTIARLLLLAAAALIAAACQRNELPEVGNPPAATPVPLTISVSDGGFANAEPQPDAPHSPAQTRYEVSGYSGNEYKTKFGAGYQIGVYVVKGSGESGIRRNICFTMDKNGTWQPQPGQGIYEHAEGWKYYAYYPYTPEATDYMFFRSGDNLHKMFKIFIQKFMERIPKDQSTYAKHTAADLMIGEGTLSTAANGSHNLTFKMEHTLNLAVFNLPTLDYIITLDPSQVVGRRWRIPARGMTLNCDGYTPYIDARGEHRILLPRDLSYNGYYLGHDNKRHSFKGDLNFSKHTYTDLPLGKYKRISVIGNSNLYEKTKIRQLKVGDLMLRDGSIVPHDRARLSDLEKASCIGIVFYLRAMPDDKYDNYRPHLNAEINGYVMAVDDIQSKHWHANRNIGNVGATHRSGYLNTLAMQNAAGGPLSPDNFAAAHACVTKDPPRAYTSGWYMPSMEEMRAIMNNIDEINRQFVKLGKQPMPGSQYWTSNQADTENAYYVNSHKDHPLFSFGPHRRSLNYQTTGTSVRPILTF